MKKIKEVKQPKKRPRGRPRMEDPTTVVLTFKVRPSEAKALRDLVEETKADSFTALMRNFVSAGLIWLKQNSQKDNKVFYERFSRYWDITAHLSMYSDDLGKKLKLQEKIDLLKKTDNC